jgi:hypothetical protein
MTLNVQQTGKVKAKVQFTYGPVNSSIEEDIPHLRYFWNQLGILLNKMELEYDPEGNSVEVGK